MVKIKRNSSNFHHFLEVYDPKVPTQSNQWAKSVRKTGINSFSWMTCNGRHIPSYLSNPPLLGPWHWFPGRINGIRGVKRLHSIQPHRRYRSRVAIVMGPSHWPLFLPKEVKTATLILYHFVTLSPNIVPPPPFPIYFENKLRGAGVIWRLKPVP